VIRPGPYGIPAVPGPPTGSGLSVAPRTGTGPEAGPAGTAAPGEAAPGEAAPGDAASTVGAVEASVAALDELDDLPVAEHVGRYDALHGELSNALAAIDGV
jgi:hypothetical protein